ncbi:MAG: AGE family epimerase/isomerase [Lentisphaeria bacterium]|nr:AGE family epimerase/isomerase [Lentisphaeria bacterium]
MRTTAELAAFHDTQLREHILPFWLARAQDEVCGGYVTCLDEKGEVYDWDKLCMWAQGRLAWTFARMYNELEQRDEWLEFAGIGIAFIQDHGFADDGTMHYALTREGHPLQPAQDVYTELSTILAFAEFARATGDRRLAGQAVDLMDSVWHCLQEPGQAFQPTDAATRPARLHGHSMITLNVLQELRKCCPDLDWQPRIDACLEIMLKLHLHRDREALFELVDWDTGDQLPGWQGRWVNPGHMIEGGTFVIHEGQFRGDQSLVDTGVSLIEWGFEHGWDSEFGGIHNDIDIDGAPIPTGVALLADSKIWWQHAEALYGLLLAHAVSGRESFLDAYWQVHEYAIAHFVPSTGGEWACSLDRRGNVVCSAKGTARKSAFHVARNHLLCRQLLTREDRV